MKRVRIKTKKLYRNKKKIKMKTGEMECLIRKILMKTMKIIQL